MDVCGAKGGVLAEIVKPAIAGKDLAVGLHDRRKGRSIFSKRFIKKTYSWFDAGNEIGRSFICEGDIVIVFLAEGQRELTQETPIRPVAQAQDQNDHPEEHTRQ